MLRPPYTGYNRLYTYHLDLADLPEIDDPDLIGAWLEDDTAILFFHRPKERLVGKLCAATGARMIYQADLDYSDWEAGRKIEPFTVGDLTVAPVWEETPAQIRLDPSVIFGSGFHPSTRLCLEALIQYGTTPEVPLRSVLDLGCGTGLLAIAAALKGAEQVTAVDNNNLACRVARANTMRNKVDNAVTVRRLDLRKDCPDTARTDLVMANLYKGLMIELFETDTFWNGSLYLLSGFISSMEEELLAHLPVDKVRFLERKRVERWCLWVLAAKEATGSFPVP